MPVTELAVETIGVVPPGERRLVVQDIEFSLSAGSGLGVIGPSGSGKSSLARALVGVWPLVRGQIRLDGAAIEQWRPMHSADISGICRKMSNFSQEPSRKTLPVSIRPGAGSNHRGRQDRRNP